MSHNSWEDLKAERGDAPDAQAGHEEARRAYEVAREIRRQRDELRSWL
jgi:hypothetical protein